MKISIKSLSAAAFLFATSITITIGLAGTAQAYIPHCCIIYACEPPCVGDNIYGLLVSGVGCVIVDSGPCASIGARCDCW